MTTDEDRPADLERRLREAEERAGRLLESEARAKHLKGLLGAIREVNRIIVREKDASCLMDKACEALATQTGYNGVWAVLLKPGLDQVDHVSCGRTFCEDVASESTEEFSRFIDHMEKGLWPQCMRAAFAHNEIVITRNLQTDCGDCAISSLYASSAAFTRSLRVNSSIRGVVSAAIPIEYADDEEEQAIFIELADDLAHALHAIAQSEEAHREHRHLVQVIAGAGLGTWEWRVQEDRVIINDLWAEMLGYRRQDLEPCSYETWRRLVHPDDLEATEGILKACIEEPAGDYECEFRMRNAEGQWRWIQACGSVQERDSNGEPTRMFGTHSDITDRKKRENDLRQGTAFEELVRLVSADFVMAGPGDKDQVINNALSRIGKVTGSDRVYVFQFSKDGLSTDNTHEWCREGVTPEIENLQNIPLDRDLPWLAKRIRRRDTVHLPRVSGLPEEAAAERRHLESQGIKSLLVVPLCTQEGVTGFLGLDSVNTPTTWSVASQSRLRLLADLMANYLAREQAAQSLRETSALLSTILDGIPDIIGLQAPDLTVRRYNKAGYEILGVTGEDLSGRKCFEFIGRTEPCEACDALKVVANGKPAESERYVPELDRYFVCRSTPVLNENGQVELIVEQLHDVTESKRFEEALERSEEKHRSLYENAPLAYQSLDENGCLIEMNPKWLSMLGYERDDVIGRSFADFLHEDWRPHFEKNFPAFKKRGYVRDVEFRMKRKSGDYIDVMFEGCIGYLPDGSFRQTYCVFKDITDQRKTERDLRDSNSRLKGVLQHSPLLISEFDLEGRYLLANQAVCDFFGVDSPDALVGSRFTDLLPLETQKVFAERIQRIRDERRPIIVADQLEGGRETRFYSTVLYPLFDQEGKVSSIAGIAQDVTEQYRAEEALRNSEEVLHAALDAVSDGIWELDVQTGAASLNRRSLEMFGFAPDEPIPHSDEVFARVHPEDLPRIRAALADHAEGRTEAYNQEFRIQLPDGSTRWLLGRGRVIEFDDEGRARKMIGTNIDVTARYELEDQYRQAQKMEAVGQLTGGVAHDFNNLLQVINGYTEIAVATLDEKHPVHELLGEVSAAGARAARLVSQLLAFSRRQIMQPEHLDLGTVVSDLLKMLGRVIGEHVRLEWRQPARPTPVYADRGMIEQACLNLSVNARDAMPGGGRLTIEVERAVLGKHFCESNAWAVPGCYALLRVTDTGSGMDAETLEHVFEPFFTTKETGKGTGLGLSTVYGIVKQHEGLINVRSESDEGTSVDLYWPVAEEPRVEAAEDREETVAGGTETVLLAEDDEMVSSLAQSILTRAGYRVLVASNGREAVELFAAHRDEIQLAVLDVVMPEMGGREALDKMLEISPGLRAVFVSGYSEKDIHSGFVLDEGLTLVRKPFSRQALLKAIRTALD